MAKPERSDSSQSTPNSSRIWNFLNPRRSSLQPADTPVVAPAGPEKTPLDIHRERVAAKMLGFFNAVDARVGDWIGYSGNIREELKGRTPERSSYQRELDTQDLDPALQSYVQHNVFLLDRIMKGASRQLHMKSIVRQADLCPRYMWRRQMTDLLRQPCS